MEVVIRWTAEDVMCIAEDNDIEMSREAADAFLKDWERYIEEISIERGWEVIQDALLGYR